MQAMFGQEPPIYFRSIRTERFPFLAWVQVMYLPASPLPRTTRSYSSGGVCIASISYQALSGRENSDHLNIPRVDVDGDQVTILGKYIAAGPPSERVDDPQVISIS
jgi:hypothetical protein